MTTIKTCSCIALARRSFTNASQDGGEWWVCNQCGHPTAAWLASATRCTNETDDDTIDENERTSTV